MRIAPREAQAGGALLPSIAWPHQSQECLPPRAVDTVHPSSEADSVWLVSNLFWAVHDSICRSPLSCPQSTGVCRVAACASLGAYVHLLNYTVHPSSVSQAQKRPTQQHLTSASAAQAPEVATKRLEAGSVRITCLTCGCLTTHMRTGSKDQ